MLDRRTLWKIPAAIGVVVLVIGAALILGKEAGLHFAAKKRTQERAKKTQTVLEQMNTITVGKTIPFRAFEDLDYNLVQLSEVLSERTLISFFEPNCDGCLPDFERLKEAVSDSIEYRYFIFVSSSSREDVEAYREQHGILAWILLDDGSDFSRELGVFTFPFNIIVNRSGEVLDIIAGALDTRESVEIIKVNRAVPAGER